MKLVMVGLVVACSTQAVPQPRVDHDVVAWSAPTASAYLERRAAQWLDERACALSCHTTHPFVFMGQAGGVRDRILDAVKDRVEAWPDVAWWYDADAAKISESRGTEAVLNAFALAGTADATRALDIMFAEQRADGGWSWLDFSLAPWEEHRAEILGASFAAIAVARSGYQPTSAQRTRLIDFITRRLGAANLHDKLTVLWAASYESGLLPAAQRAAFVSEVGAVQRRDGSFALAELGTWVRTDGTPNRATAGDAYSTGFAAYVLARIDPVGSADRIARARNWLVTRQDQSGAWIGVSLNDDDAFNRGLMSDAATAFAMLALR
ncbi:MAG: hypothetical protein ACKV2T_35855 [Kofleriaceae bacterium]